MITVRDLLKRRSDVPPIQMSPVDPVYRALQLMAENNAGAVVICDGERMVGIFTERDYCRKIILMGRSSVNTPIQDIMTKKMVTIRPEQSLEDCMQLMTRYHIRHLPVEEAGHLVGLVSMRDVMEMIISAKQDRINALENYILGVDYNK